MPVDHSEFTIVKTLDKATPKLFSDDAVAAAMAGPDTSVTLERCFVKSWSTSGDADDRPTADDSFDFTDYGDGGSSDGLADGSVRHTDTSAVATLMDFDFMTEPTTAPDVAVYNGFEVINSTSLDGIPRYGGGLAVDPNNPNGQVTFGGSITLQNIVNLDVHTLNDWFHI